MTYLKAPEAGDTDPGIHILLIGVTNYFHLPGGRGEPFALADDFDVLDAPDYSGRALADWFLGGNLTHPMLPVKSIELLGSRLRHQKEDGAKVPVDVPTFANVQQAIERWFALGDVHPQNLLIFYFCGHGLQDGVGTHSLLCADFGAHRLNPFDHAVHYEGLEAGMRACAARQQVFLLDICRRTEPRISRRYGGPGNKVVALQVPDDAADVAQSVIWATSSGAGAFARKNKPSAFAEAFIKCFEGGAASQMSQMPGAYATARSISQATAAWMEANGEVPQEPQSSQPAGKPFVLHRFGAFTVPVFVRCIPQAATDAADFSCWEDGRKRRSRRAGTGNAFWRLDLPKGTYTFKAQIRDLVFEGNETMVYPPLAPVFIEV